MGRSRVTAIGRASYPHLGTPDGFGMYSMQLLLPKGNAEVEQFVKDLRQDAWDECIASCGQGAEKAYGLFTALKDGDDTSQFKTYHGEFANHYILSLRRKADFGKPCVVNTAKQPIDPSEIYAGCDVACFIDIYSYNFSGKKSVSVSLQHVMKVADNTPFVSRGPDPEQAFADMDIPAGEVGPPIPNAAAQGAIGSAQAGPPPPNTPGGAPVAGTNGPPPTNPFGGV